MPVLPIKAPSEEGTHQMTVSDQKAGTVTARAFTETEQAQNHCQIGNQGLAIKVILDWLDQTGGRTPNPQ